MDKLRTIKEWLEDFSINWDREDDLQGNSPVSYRLTLEDEKILRRTEDVLGGSRLVMQLQLSLIRISYLEENPSLWVGEFSDWVDQQSAHALAPWLGEGITHYRLEKGKLETNGDKAVYTVKIIATYEKLFEVN